MPGNAGTSASIIYSLISMYTVLIYINLNSLISMYSIDTTRPDMTGEPVVVEKREVDFVDPARRPVKRLLPFLIPTIPAMATFFAKVAAGTAAGVASKQISDAI